MKAENCRKDKQNTKQKGKKFRKVLAEKTVVLCNWLKEFEVEMTTWRMTADHAKKAENSSILAEQIVAEVLVEYLIKNNRRRRRCCWNPNQLVIRVLWAYMVTQSTRSHHLNILVCTLIVTSAGTHRWKRSIPGFISTSIFWDKLAVWCL